jgi:rhodanese-related sulfurtransferase
MSISLPVADGRSDRKWRTVFRRTFLQAFFLCGFALMGALLTARFSSATTLEEPREITVAQISSAFPGEKILWVDARPAAVFAQDHVPGAVWLAEESWEEGLPKFVDAWTPGQPIVVYCSSTQCGASRSVARRLVREFNATRVHFLQGGWDAWRARK